MQTTTLPEGWGLKGSHPDDYEAGITPDAIDGKAAAYLRAARLTDDASERQALRRKAAELLEPRAARGRGRAAR